MPIFLDQQPQPMPGTFTEHSTLGDIMQWVRTILPEGRVVVSITLNDVLLEGPALSHARRDAIGTSTLALKSADQKELSLTMLGKLAALIEWLSPQHKDVALLLEQGNTQLALQRLQGVLSAWQQIQSAFGNLAKMTELSLNELPVHDLHAEAVLEEFCRQLGEIHSALESKDFVLLADILQYEMDGAVSNWMALLEATLGVIEPAGVA